MKYYRIGFVSIATLAVLLVTGLTYVDNTFEKKLERIEIGQTKAEVIAIMGEEPQVGKGIGISQWVRTNADGNGIDESGNLIEPASLPEYFHWFDGENKTIQIKVKDGVVTGIRSDGF